MNKRSNRCIHGLPFSTDKYQCISCRQEVDREINMIKTYQKKPVKIVACQFDGTRENAIQIRDWIMEDESKNASVFGSSLSIETLEGVMTANPGDYIIKGIRGEFYPCRKDIFEDSYEEVI